MKTFNITYWANKHKKHITRQGKHDEKSRYGRIESPVVLINHWRWLVANGYKKEAASCKRQASSLTRQHYRSIKDYAKKEKNKTNN